jgi:SAM-dependent methyltransferase
MDYTAKLIALLREEQVRRNEAKKSIGADSLKHPGHVGHAKAAAHTEPTRRAASVKGTSAAQPPENPGETELNLITSVSEIPGYEATSRRPGIRHWKHSSKGKERHAHTHTRKEPSLLAEAGITIVRLNHMKALEVGCGDGIPVAEILLAEELHVVGVDISGTQIALCQAHFPDQTTKRQASWMRKDMMALQFPREEFDAIVALYSLFHLPREEQTVFLARARQWLKPGGLILFNFPQEENEGEVEERWLGLEKGWVYWSSWGEEKTIRLIEGLGGMEVVMKEVTVAEARNPDPKFVWVIAKKCV